MTSESISWKNSNLALIGSDLDLKIKHAAAQLEDAWHGMGQVAPEVRVWRIEKFQVKAWPTEQYGRFHMGDSYIVLYTYKKGRSERLHHNLHIWIGAESTQDEYGTAAYKMVEASDYLGGIPVQHREVQGHESELFKSYFEFLEYLEGGIESGFHHVVEPTKENPVLFRVKGTHKQMTLCQVPLSKSSLNCGDSFILKADKAKVWCWNGRSAKPLEKANAVMWAEFMCTLGTVTVVTQDDDEEEEHPDFWEYLGDGEIGPDLEDDHLVVEFRPKLYRVDGGPKNKQLELVAEGAKVKKTSKICSCLPERTILDTSGDDVFLLDSGWDLFVWVGTGADKKAEKLATMSAIDRYVQMEPRAMELPATIVKQGMESDQFWAYFEGPNADKSRVLVGTTSPITSPRRRPGIRSAGKPWEKEAKEQGGWALASLSLVDETFARIRKSTTSDEITF